MRVVDKTNKMHTLNLTGKPAGSISQLIQASELLQKQLLSIQVVDVESGHLCHLDADTCKNIYIYIVLK